MYVCVWGGGGGGRSVRFIFLNKLALTMPCINNMIMVKRTL